MNPVYIFKEDAATNTRQFALYSTNGEKETSEWDIGDHESHGVFTEGVKSDWYADTCWRYIYKNDGSGNEIFGLRSDLISDASNGHRVKVVVNMVSFEATEILIHNDHLCVFVYNSLSKSAIDTFSTSVHWEWMICCTDGTIKTVLYEYGSSNLNGTRFENAAMSWYIDTFEHYKVYSTGPSGAVVEGSKNHLIHLVRLGADVRMKVTNEFGHLSIFKAEYIRFFGSDTITAVNTRRIGLLYDPTDGYKVEHIAFHKSTVATTEGSVDFFHWTVGENVLLDSFQKTKPIAWYISL